ncbi:MAG: metal ABC transporter ATP-binding protein [Calditerrivibrio sp.]|nr:metal ABC transporter ATP-binding protein [Calditerrivibrio sp.]
MIKIENLYFKYPGENQWTLEDVSIEVREKDYLIIIGPNGGGKTTLLKLILGILKPNKGYIHFNRSLFKIGYVPQQISTKKSFPITVKKTITLGVKNCSNLSNLEQIVLELNIQDILDKKISELSGGQLQRVLLARALISEPDLLILDEPTSNVDPYGTFCFFSYLEQLNKKMTIILVTHNLGLVTSGAKSVACVNKKLIYLNSPNINNDMINLMYGIHDSHLCNLNRYLNEEISHITNRGTNNVF